jgi:lysyl oxidase
MSARSCRPPEAPLAHSLRVFACGALVAALGLGCNDPAHASGQIPLGGGDAEAEAPEPPPETAPPRDLCGGPGEPCCDPPLPACAPGSTCQSSPDSPAPSCAPEARDTPTTRLCRTDLDCPTASTCCPAGAFGNCLQLGASECPVPDLTLAASSASEYLVTAVALDVSASGCTPEAGCDCLLERGCALEPGARRVLSIQPLPLNIGGADLLLGDPESSPLYDRDSCTRLPFVDHFLRYQLIDDTGAVRVSQDSRLVPSCRASDVQRGPLASQFSCEQQGLAHGLSNRRFEYEYPFEETGTFGSNDCPYVDVTDIPAGRYRIVIGINPERLLAESRYDNNDWSVTVDLPSFDDPLRPCPDSGSLLFRSNPLECGWTEAALPASTCVPGARMELGCPSCAGTPALRVCPGDTPCSALEALPLDARLTTSPCPEVFFTCPESGRFDVLSSSSDFGGSQPPQPAAFRCDLVLSPAAAGGARF